MTQNSEHQEEGVPEVINVHDAKTHLSRLLERASGGERLVIARSGKPVAMLGPLPSTTRRRRFDVFPGAIRMADDFDESLSEAEFMGDAEVEP